MIMAWFVYFMLLLSLGVYCHGNNCFPVKEGDSCTLTCRGQLPNKDWILRWHVIKGNDSHNVYTHIRKVGHWRNTGSVVKSDNDVEIGRLQKNKNGFFNSTITFPNVTGETLKWTVECSINWQLLLRWDMSKGHLPVTKDSQLAPTSAVSVQDEPGTPDVQSTVTQLTKTLLAPGLTSHVSCEAYTLDKARIVMSLNGQQLSGGKTEVKVEIVSDKTFFRSSMLVNLTQDLLPAKRAEHPVMVKCRVTPGDGQSLQDTTELEVKWPADQPPKFRYQSQPELQGEIFVKKENVTMSCPVDKGQSYNSLFDQCNHLTESLHFLEAHSENSFVMFALLGSEYDDGRLCRKSVEPPSSCYNLVASLTFSDMSSSRSPSTPQAALSSQNSTRRNYILGLIIAGGIGFAVLIVLMGAALNVIHRWPSLYDYVTGSQYPRPTNAEIALPIYETTRDPSVVYDNEGTIHERVVEGSESEPSYILPIDTGGVYDMHNHTEVKSVD